MPGNRGRQLLDRTTEKPILEALYTEHGVATDQLRRDPDTLHEIRRSFNRLTSNDHDAGVLLRYMVNRRKCKDWPRLGSSAKRFDPLTDLLSDSQLEILRKLYLQTDLPSDEYLYRPAVMRTLADNFHTLSGNAIEASTLVAVVVAKRKRGQWVRIRDGFNDIAAVL